MENNGKWEIHGNWNSRGVLSDSVSLGPEGQGYL